MKVLPRVQRVGAVERKPGVDCVRVKTRMPKSRQHKKSGRRRSPQRRFSFADDGAEQKMSAVLLEFIEPCRDEALDDVAVENLIALGIVAWNVALLPPDKREESLNDFCAKLFRRRWRALFRRSGRWLRKLIGKRREAAPEVEPPEVADFKQVAYELIERKLRYYPHNRRFIVDYRLTMTKDDVHLSVVSTLPS